MNKFIRIALIILLCYLAYKVAKLLFVILCACIVGYLFYSFWKDRYDEYNKQQDK